MRYRTALRPDRLHASTALSGQQAPDQDRKPRGSRKDPSWGSTPKNVVSALDIRVGDDDDEEAEEGDAAELAHRAQAEAIGQVVVH